MEGVIQTIFLFGAVMFLLWSGDHIDQWIQKFRGFPADEYGRVPDGPFVKLLIVFIVGGFFIAYAINGGGSGNPSDDCFGSMRC